MTVLGNLVVLLALIASVLGTVQYYRAVSSASVLGSARLWVRLSGVGVLLASILLLILLLRHEFANGYVYSYSSRSLPLHFLISSFYAGQEGSFLFWALCAALISFVLMRSTRRHKNEASVMAVYMGVQSFLLMLLFVKTPFISVWDKIAQIPAGQVPADGSGLNPLLQNFWMVIHPPVLFIGFAAMAVPFSFAVAGLWKKNYTLIATQAFAWVLGGVLVLGLGIMLGAYWAYGVLGWGGYWGWDPVENSSLVPWITGVALIHTILVQRRSQKFIRTSHFLALVSFILVVYSTFLTRSGVLGDSSVHSFTDPGAAAYWLLLAFLVALSFVGFGLLRARWDQLKVAQTAAPMMSRETALGAGAIALILSAIVILFGTSLPIFSATTVEPSFYDSTNLPIAIAMALLIGLSLYFQWGVDEAREVLRRAWKTFLASAVVTGALWFLGVQDAAVLVLAFTSIFALLVNLEIGMKIVRGDPRFLGGKLAHIGLALFFLGVISTGKYGETKHLSLEINTPQEAFGQTLTYTGYSPISNGKFAFHVVVEKDGERFDLAPVMFETGDQGLMRNPDIKSFATWDFYLSPVSLQQVDNGHGETAETYTIQKGETVSIGTVKATFVKFDMGQHDKDAMAQGSSGMSVGSVLQLTNGSATEMVTPVAVYSMDGAPTYKATQSKLMNAQIQLVSMNVGMGSEASAVTVGVTREDGHMHAPEALVVEASIKPYINLLWGGTLVMMFGFVLSILKRAKE